MKKTILTFFTLLLALLVLTGCGDDEEKEYTVKFDAAGGSVVLDYTGTSIPASPVTTKDGFTFGGWATQQGDNTAIAFPYKLTKNITLYAIWNENATLYTVNFYTDGTLYHTTNVSSGTVVQKPTDPSKPDHDFLGWVDSNNTEYVFTTTVTNNLNLYANWKNNISEFSVSFDTNGGLLMEEVVTSCIEVEPVPTYTGKEFLGWYDNPSFNGDKISFPYTVTKSVTLYAKWDTTILDEKFTVTFETNGGTPLASIETNLISEQPVSTKTNAHLVGWYDNSEFRGSRIVFPYTVAGDTTLYARWQNEETMTSEQKEFLESMLSLALTNYQFQYLLDVKALDVETNENIQIYKGASSYYIDGNKMVIYTPATDEDGNFVKDDNGNFVYYQDFMFYIEGENEYHYYSIDTSGTYKYNENYYKLYVTSSPYKELIDTVIVKNLNLLDVNNFYFYENKFYAKSDYVDDLAKLILGDESSQTTEAGIQTTVSEAYTEFYITFTTDHIYQICGTSSIMSYSGSVGTIAPGTTYDVIREVTFNQDSFDNVGNIPDETSFETDGETPSGLYPVLNDNDPYRQGYVTDGQDYTVEQLVNVLSQLNNYKVYYTSLVNFNTQLLTDYCTYQLISVDDEYGKMENIGYTTPSYYYYDENTKTTYSLVYDRSASTYVVYCDKYSYQNNYDYNQYLATLLEYNAMAYNFNVPTANLHNLPTSFTWDSNEKCFVVTGNLKEVGKLIFGDMDYVNSPSSEVETYKYIKIFMNEGKIARIVAASYLDYYENNSLDPSYTDYYMKELMFIAYGNQSFTLPTYSGVFALPGEEDPNGTLDALTNAFTYMGVNYTYQDIFCYDDTDEVIGLTDDIYKYDGAKAQIANKDYFYYVDGKPYYYYTNTSSSYLADDEWIDWGTPILNMLDVNWFYLGKDGNYYCKEEYLSQCGDVLTRFSGTRYFLSDMSSAYRMDIILDFIQLTMAGQSIKSIYYVGNIRVTGTSGSHKKIFSGYATFTNVGYTTVSLPTSITEYDTQIPENVIRTVSKPTVVNVSDDAVLTFEDVKRATYYQAYVYLNNTLVDGFPINVTSGYNLKDHLEDGTYTVRLQACGEASKVINSELSDAIEFVVSKYKKLADPTNLVASTKSQQLRFDAVEGCSRYQISIRLNNQTLAGYPQTITTTTYDLKDLQPGTYEILITALGDNQTYRDSNTVSIQYSVTTDEKTYLEKYFDELTGSFYASNASSLKVRDKDGNIVYELSFKYYYDVTTQRGKMIAKIMGPDNDFDYQNPAKLVTIEYYKEGNIDKAKFIIYTRSDNKTTEEIKDMPRPFVNAANVDLDLFTESGTVTTYWGLKYLYTGTDNAYPSSISLLEELFDTTFTYTSFYYTYSEYASNPLREIRMEATDGTYTYQFYVTLKELGGDFSEEVK